MSEEPERSPEETRRPLDAAGLHADALQVGGPQAVDSVVTHDSADSVVIQDSVEASPDGSSAGPTNIKGDAHSSLAHARVADGASAIAASSHLHPLVPMKPMRVISVDNATSSKGAHDVPSGMGSSSSNGTPSIDSIEVAEVSANEDLAVAEDLGEEEFEEYEPTPALPDEDLQEHYSAEPPEVETQSFAAEALPLVNRSLRPLPPVRANAAASPVSLAAAPGVAVSLPGGAEAPAPVISESRPVAHEQPESSERKPPSPPQRSLKPALPSVKPRRKPWWEEVFGDDFSRAHKPLSDAQIARESEFIIRTLELHGGSVVLDLCCGQGQLAIELSRRGFPVVGYDLSVFQLAVAADYAQSARQKINFLQGDIREMAFDSMFDAIVCWDTSFGYFEEEKNLDVVRRMFLGLKPGGSLLLDIMNRDYAAREAPSNHWFEGDGCICMDDMSLDWITSRLKVKRSVILDDGRSKELTYSIRVYNLSEIGKLLHDVGFRVLSVSGHTSTPGAFLGSRSPRIIIRALRPE